MYVAVLQSGPRAELQKVNQLRQEKIKQKKELRDQMAGMKRVDMVSRRSDRLSICSACMFSRGATATVILAAGIARGRCAVEQPPVAS